MCAGDIDLGRQIDVPAIFQLFESLHFPRLVPTFWSTDSALLFSQGLICSHSKGLREAA